MQSISVGYPCGYVFQRPISSAYKYTNPETARGREARTRRRCKAAALHIHRREKIKTKSHKIHPEMRSSDAFSTLSHFHEHASDSIGPSYYCSLSTQAHHPLECRDGGMVGARQRRSLRPAFMLVHGLHVGTHVFGEQVMKFRSRRTNPRHTESW